MIKKCAWPDSNGRHMGCKSMARTRNLIVKIHDVLAAKKGLKRLTCA